jgi:cell division protein FtsI (penicillin-binding protein 3)
VALARGAAAAVTRVRVLSGRAIYLQGLHNNFLQQKGEARYGRVNELPATRGIITDRNREPLAISTPVESVWGERRGYRDHTADSAWLS